MPLKLSSATKCFVGGLSGWTAVLLMGNINHNSYRVAICPVLIALFILPVFPFAVRPLPAPSLTD